MGVFLMYADIKQKRFLEYWSSMSYKRSYKLLFCANEKMTIL